MATETDTAPWLDEIVLESEGQWQAQWQVDEQVRHGRALLLQARQNTGSGVISFAAMPAGESVTVIIHGRPGNAIELDELARDATVDVRIQPTPQGCRMRLGAGAAGTIRVVAEGQHQKPPIISANEGSRATLVLAAGVLWPAEVGPHVHVELAGAELVNGEYQTLHLVADTLVRSSSNETTRVERLIVDGDHALTLGNKINLGKVKGASVQATLSLAGGTARQNLQVQVHSAESVTISGAADTKLTVAGLKAAKGATFEGAMTVAVANRAEIESLHFAGTDAGVPQVSVGQAAFVLGVTGEFVLHDAPDAHIVARDGAGFLLRQVVSKQGRSVCPNAFISGFRLPGRLRGRTMLDALAEAHHLEPATESLPGWEYRLGGRKGWPWSKRPSRELLQQDAELMREMRRLTHEKGSSGAARTKVGWCSQRLRHATTQGYWENLALWGYRMLGYGERPGPAFLTWVVAAVLAAIAVSTAPLSVSWPSAGVFVGEVFSQMLGPLTAITRTGASGDIPDWHFAVRAVIAIPMVVGLLSLRSYVRAAE